MRITLSIFFLAGLLSCSSNQCYTCTSEADQVVEFCEDDGITYTNTDGEAITIEEYVAFLEEMGSTCE